MEHLEALFDLFDLGDRAACELRAELDDRL